MSSRLLSTERPTAWSQVILVTGKDATPKGAPGPATFRRSGGSRYQEEPYAEAGASLYAIPVVHVAGSVVSVV